MVDIVLSNTDSKSDTTRSYIFEAFLGSDGLIRGKSITMEQAVLLRRNGTDVGVIGKDLAANRSLARQIENLANGKVKRCPHHSNAGPNASPHFQPDPRPPEGHTFYETPNRKSL